MIHQGGAYVLFDTVAVPEDMDRVRDLVTQSGNFTPEEVGMAVELVEAKLTMGDKSGYFFLFSREPSGQLSGYACYGPITATDGRFDFYWLVVVPELQGSGLGQRLQEAAEAAMKHAGAKRIYLETSSTPGYRRAQGFYAKTGYHIQCVLKDYYRAGDDNLIYMKSLSE